MKGGGQVLKYHPDLFGDTAIDSRFCGTDGWRAGAVSFNVPSMAVSCTRCGRHYDVTLFQFGRTITCACGARVGREVEERVLSPRAEPRFHCDAMLGRLARWLRALGFDTAYDADIADADLVRRAWEEGRWILTCDRRLQEEWRVGGCLVLHEQEPLTRLAEVLSHFGISEPRCTFTRCLECNEALETIDAETASDRATETRAADRAARTRVPDRVLRAHDMFSYCPGCGRVYWEGSHTRRMRRRLKEFLERAGNRD